MPEPVIKPSIWGMGAKLGEGMSAIDFSAKKINQLTFGLMTQLQIFQYVYMFVCMFVLSELF
jgi:hypothetical protein